MSHTISALVLNQPGVLARVAGLFSGRGFNIESLCVAETLDPSISRMTIVTRGNDQVIEQITKQLNKLVDIIKVVDFFGSEYVDREMMLIKVTSESSSRAEILRITDIFRGKIVDVTPKSYTIEVSGDENKIRAIIDLLKPMGIKEVVRTGKVAISRGSKGI
ncbi:MAG: acetolactate synthase small subunit [Desulfobacteria bacterium]